MNSIINKYRTIVFYILSFILLFVLVSLYLFFRVNLNESVRLTLKNYAAIDVNFSNMEIKGINKAIFSDFSLYDKFGESLIETEKLEITYSIFQQRKINKLTLYTPKVNFVLEEENKINIIENFINTEDDNSSEENIIESIEVINGIVNFQDTNHPKVIERKLFNTNGVINFDGLDIDANFNATRGLEKYFISSTISGDDTSIVMEFENINIDNYVMQYAFVDDNISYERGIADIYVNIKNDDLEAKGIFSEVIINQIEVNSEIKSVKGEFFVKNDYVKVNGDAVIADVSLDLDITVNGVNTTLIAKPTVSFDSQFGNLFNPIRKLEIDFVGNIDDSKFYLNIDNDGNINIDMVIKSQNMVIEGNVLEDINGVIGYRSKNDIVTLDNFRFKYCLDEYLEAEVLFNGDILKNNLDGVYEIKNIDSYANIDPIIGKIYGDLETGDIRTDFIDKNESIIGYLDYNLNTTLGEISLKINEPIKIKIPDTDINIELDGDYLIDFDIQNQRIKNGLGKINLYNLLIFDKISSNFKLNDGKIKFSDSYIVDGINYIKFFGDVNINNLSYNFVLDENSIELHQYYREIGFGSKLKLNGNIVGKNLDLKSELSYVIDNVKFHGEQKDLSGTLAFKNSDKGFTVEGKSKFGELVYDFQKINNLEMHYSYENNIIEVRRLFNNNLELSGNYDLEKEELNINTRIRNYAISELEILKDLGVSVEINQLLLSIAGDINSPRIVANLNSGTITQGENAININGNVIYEDDKINISKLNIEENILSGDIDLDTETLSLRINLIEKDFGRYLNLDLTDSLQADIFGELKFWGEFSNVRSLGEVFVSEIFYEGTQYPNVNIGYTINELDIFNLDSSGRLSISNISLLNEDSVEMIKGFGEYRIKDNYFIFEIDDKLQLEDSKKLLNLDELYGDAKIDFNISGDFDDYSYSLEMTSDELKIYDVVLENINNEITGDKESINLKNMSLYYNDNYVVAEGILNLDPFNYKLDVNAPQINLEFLQFFLSDTFNLLEGIATINLTIDSEESRGTILLEEINANISDDMFSIKDFSGQITLDNQQISFASTKGTFNDGKTTIRGGFNIEKIELNTLFDYDFNIENFNSIVNFERAKVDYSENIFGEISGQLSLRNKEIIGDININNFAIREIPDFNDNGTSKDNNILPKDFSLQIGVNIINPIDVVLYDMTVLENLSPNIDLEIKLDGSGTFSIDKSNNMNFMGTLVSNTGIISFNNSDFKITSGIVAFDDPYSFFPDIDPSVSLIAQTNIAGEVIYVNIGGYLEKLDIDLSSSSGYSDQDILSLLAIRHRLGEADTQGILRDVLDRQLSRRLISDPISRGLQNLLGLEKVLFVSELELESLNSTLFREAELELGDYLYLERLGWTLRTRWSRDNYSQTLYDEEQEDVFQLAGDFEYLDAELDYLISEGYSLSLGVRLNNELEEINRFQLKLGWEFEKKYYQLSDLYEIIDFNQ